MMPIQLNTWSKITINHNSSLNNPETKDAVFYLTTSILQQAYPCSTMKSRSNTWRCDVAEIRGRWSRLGERSFKKSSRENNEKPTLAPAAKPNKTFPRRSKGSD